MIQLYCSLRQEMVNVKPDLWLRMRKICNKREDGINRVPTTN